MLESPNPFKVMKNNCQGIVLVILFDWEGSWTEEQEVPIAMLATRHLMSKPTSDPFLRCELSAMEWKSSTVSRP